MAKKTISRVQAFQVAKLMEEFVKTDANGKLTWQELAERFGKELGFEISFATVQNLAKEMGIGVRTPNMRGGPSLSDDVRINLIGNAVRALYVKLGEPLPADFPV